MSTKRSTDKSEQQGNGVASGRPAKTVAGRTESITVADYVTLVGTGRTSKRRKYNNTPTVLDSIRFDSRREATRYQELTIMQQHGLIHDLRLQVPFLLEVNGQKIAKYVADFQYEEDGHRVIEDAKGVKTPAYRIKKKLMLALHGIAIRET